ncbi:hypothetical protein [Dethiothermospora halolimnae]|uniref:hypothetical protein n=1 Tax=Dethiothermospora halolimnae TaxID=3114390 RepID=UPI003CCC368A
MKSKRLILLFVIIVVLLIIFFTTNLFRNRKIIDYNQGMENAIIEYTKENVYSKYHNRPKFEMYESHKVFEVEKKWNRIYVYAYVLNEIHYMRDDVMGITANIDPVVIVLKEEDQGKYRVTKLKTPESGEGYPSSIRSLFPKHIAEKIFNNRADIHTELTNTMQKIK